MEQQQHPDHDHSPDPPSRYPYDPVQEMKSKFIFALVAFGGMILAKLLGC